MKQLLTIALVALTTTAIAQPYIGMSGTNRGLGMQAGGLIDFVDVQAGYVTRVTNDAEKPQMAYASAGIRLIVAETEYTSWLVTPAIGRAYTRWAQLDETKTDVVAEYGENKMYYSLEMACERNGIRVFATGQYSEFVYGGLGVKVLIK